MLLAQEGEHRQSYLLDHLGSPIRIADQNGVVSSAITYDEFGVPDTQQSETGVSFGYAGFEADQITGLYFAQARYYDPQTARMVSPDPHWDINNMVYGDMLVVMPLAAFLPDNLAIAQSSNKYGYCLNNPLIYVDRSGEFVLTTLAIIGIGALVGGLVNGVVSGISNANQGGSFWAGFAGGFVNGAIVGAVAAIPGVGVLAVGGAGFVGGFLGNTITGALNNRNPNLPTVSTGDILKQSLFAGVTGAVGAVIGFGIGNALTNPANVAIAQACNATFNKQFAKVVGEVFGEFFDIVLDEFVPSAYTECVV